MKEPVPPQVDFPLPENLPPPRDDGAARHLAGLLAPNIPLLSTSERTINFSQRGARRTVLYCHPMTGEPGKSQPEGWDTIPGARGCTPQTCNFRDLHQDITALQVGVFGLRTQTSAYQRELVGRLHLPFEILSDAEFKFCDALRPPMFEVDGMRLVKRLTLIFRAGRIEQVFYPVFPPNKGADEVLAWLKTHPA